jgi:hypothetical protein
MLRRGSKIWQACLKLHASRLRLRPTMPPKTTAWTDDAKEAHSEKSIRARIKAAAAYKGCSVEELAAMPESELLKLPYLGRKTVEFLKKSVTR